MIDSVVRSVCRERSKGVVNLSEERRARAHAESTRLQTLGARELWINDDWRSFSIVLADPEGNEFCLQ